MLKNTFQSNKEISERIIENSNLTNQPKNILEKNTDIIKQKEYLSKAIGNNIENKNPNIKKIEKDIQLNLITTEENGNDEFNNNFKSKNKLEIESNKSEEETSPNNLNIKELTLSVFLNYSKFSKEEFQFLLSYNGLIKILKTAKIMDEFYNLNGLLKVKDFELLFIKANANSNSKNLNINQFNNFLVLLTNKMFPKEFEINPKVCLINFILEFFKPISNVIQKIVSENPDSNLFIHQSILNKFSEIQFDCQIIYIFSSIFSGLKKIYMNFFEIEISKTKEIEKVYKDSFNQIIRFCQIYEIVPYILSLDKLAIYFNLINKMNIEDIINNSDIKFIIDPKKELGILFTFSKFISLIFHISMSAYDKYSSFLKNQQESSRLNTHLGINTNNLGNAEKLILFLERMQNIENKTNSFNNRSNLRKNNFMNYSIMPPKEVINSVRKLFFLF